MTLPKYQSRFDRVTPDPPKNLQEFATPGEATVGLKFSVSAWCGRWDSDSYTLPNHSRSPKSFVKSILSIRLILPKADVYRRNTHTHVQSPVGHHGFEQPSRSGDSAEIKNDKIRELDLEEQHGTASNPQAPAFRRSHSSVLHRPADSNQLKSDKLVSPFAKPLLETTAKTSARPACRSRTWCSLSYCI
jgi:hypothetical protein